MVSGQDEVVDPTLFVNLFRDKINNHVPQEGMFVNSQWMKQLTKYIPLINYSSCQTSEDAHEYIMCLKQC